MKYIYLRNNNVNAQMFAYNDMPHGYLNFDLVMKCASVCI